MLANANVLSKAADNARMNAEETRDRLAEALEEMLRRAYNEMELRKIAREALAAVKGSSDD